MKLVNVEDARSLARRRLPRIFFDYIDGGSFDEKTLQANRRDFDKWSLEQRVLVGGSKGDLGTTFLGARHNLPFMLGPVGFLGLYAGNGEIAAAGAAHTAKIPFCLSSFSIKTISDVRASTPSGPLHFQLYMLKDRGLSAELIQAAAAAGVGALYVTVDTAVTAVRERDVRNGFRELHRMTPGLLARFLLRPSWFFDILRHGPIEVGAIANRPAFGRGILAQAASLSAQIDPTICWQDIAWLRKQWTGPLVIKGILSAADARLARDTGADAIVISNHGGRQLDRATSTISILPEIVDSVGCEMDVLVDGGFRRGAEIITALALGASGVLIGRAYAFGLAAAGAPGVASIIDILAKEIDISLALMGVQSVDQLKTLGRAALRARD
jgi:isopentenyl diphosphate isomerase/L-lactate dehydrogenase-like FMN-dependent dehydrogenase